MSQRPGMDWSCCPQGSGEVTQIALAENGRTVGLIGLRAVFDQLMLMGRRPEEVTAEELVALVRAQKNYIPDRAKAAYGAALLREYAAYWAQRSKIER
ncbi:MAG: hypothetical protein C4310_12745 [Chloroflexota bacterium]